MAQSTNIAPHEGNIFESETIASSNSAGTVTNPVALTGMGRYSVTTLTAKAEASVKAVFAVTKGHIGSATPWTGEQIATELSSAVLKDIIKDVRAEKDEQRQKELKEQKKFSIIGVCPHFWQFRNHHRAAADALPECCTYQTCVDVDDRQYGQQAIDGALRLTREPGKWRDKVVYIEHSLRAGGKCHIWLICPVGMTAIETQQAFCQELGIPCDDKVQQKQSFIYMTGDAVYTSPRWLQPLTQDEIEARQAAFQLRGLSIDGWDKVDATQPSPQGTTQPSPLDTTDIVDPTPRTDFIFDKHYAMTGLAPQDISTDGKRHNTLLSLLSTGIVQMLTLGEMKGQLRKRTPLYWQCQDCQRLLSDFYAKYNDTARAFTREQRKILAQSERIGNAATVTPHDDALSQPTCDELTLSQIYASPVPPRLNRKKMPRMVKAVTSRTPDENKECVAQACFPALMAHPVHLQAMYTDNRPRELRAGCVTVAGTAAGKACIDQPVTHIKADIKVTSDAERRSEQEYNQQVNTRAQNTDKPRRRKFRIRDLMADVTDAALRLRTADNDGAPLYCRMNEIEQWDKIERASGQKNQFTTMKINDDEGNAYGAERAGTASVTAATTLFLNWNASTTPSKLIRYMRHVVTDGPISRITMATIPDPGIGAPMPVFGNYDDGSYDAALKPYIDNLNAATGTIDCRQARQMVKELKAECDEFAIGSGDRVFDNLTHRALVHVFRKAICIYVANGMKWEASIKTFCRWSLHYDLFLKIFYFGDLIRQADADVVTSKRGPQNMLELLPDPFTAQQLSDLRFSRGMEREGTLNQLYQWLHRGKILRLTADSFKKS